jgi:penicillin amidase
MGRLIRRILVFLAIVVLLLVVAGIGGGYWFITKSLPQTDGTLALPGLQHPVTVVRDHNGVPHIYADTPADLFMAQGYIHAQDRLWQMEFNRHVGYGKLAELFGKDLVDTDKFLRTIGLARAAQRDLEAAGPMTRAYLEQYAQGVNAFIHSRQNNLPLEFTLIGDMPADWTPLDTIVWAKVMAYDLGGNYDRELLRAALQKELGADALPALVPAYPAEGPFILPDTDKNSGTGTLPNTARAAPARMDIGAPKFSKLMALNELFDVFDAGIGSNNWVVDGTKTTTGKPLLANDPHLGIQMPSVWYVNGLHCNTVSEECPFDVVGYSFPGVPAVIIGHNDRIAWGVTNVNPDVQDLYIEKLNPANPNQYEYMGKWEDMQLIPETIHVKGAPDVNLTVQVTRHGPIMSGVFEGVTEPLALQWTALREPSRILRAALEINTARNWEEFRAALRDWDVPSQNFVYADVDGNIGYQTPGNIPIRARGDGTLPVPGWTGEYEWTGYIPFAQLPTAFNPATHMIVTANNQVVSNHYPYLITQDWSPPYRAARITQLLQNSDPLSPDDFQKIQGDVYSIPLVKFQQFIQALPTDHFLTRRAMDYVRAWDGYMTPDAPAPAILEATFNALVRDLFETRLSAETYKMFQADGDNSRRVIALLLDQPQSEWWDDPATPARETRDDRLKVAYQEGVDFLGKLYGDAPPEWKWGRLHTATFAHPFGAQKPLDLLLNVGPLPTGGHAFTIANAGYRITADGYTQRTVPSMRQIIDVTNWDAMWWVITTGESGQPLSAHYSDLVNVWRNTHYETLPFTRAAVEQAKANVLTLTP